MQRKSVVDRQVDLHASEVDRYIHKKRLVKPETQIEKMVKLMRASPDAKFIDFVAIGEDMKVQLNADDNAEARKVVEKMKLKNDMIKQTVEQRIIQKDQECMDLMEEGMDLAQKEAHRRNEIKVKRQRLALLNQYLPDQRLLKLEGSSRINLEDFIHKNNGRLVLEKDVSKLVRNQSELNADFLSRSPEASVDKPDTLEDKLNRKKNFVSKFQERVSRMIKQLQSMFYLSKVKNRRKRK